MKKLLFFAALAAMFSISCAKQETMEELTARVFERAAAQFAILDVNLDSALVAKPGAAIYPRSINPDGSLWTSNYKWWCSGFYPGCLWFVYEYTGDETYMDLALKYQAGLEPLRFRTDDHDIGFQLMCSYGNCLRITGNEECVPVILDGAKSLATRFDPEVGCTRSWDNKKYTFPVIIDNMMNLELLLKAVELGGEEYLKDVALTHARTTMKNHYREDYSIKHILDYNPETGEIIKVYSGQGYAEDSAWARGQAWGLYAFPMMYRMTKEQEFLDHALKQAEYLLPRIPEDGIPYWDYDSPEIPNDVRDASSAALVACGLIELSHFVDEQKAAYFLSFAEKILRELASDKYLVAEGEKYGFLLDHSTGNKPGNSEIDVPLTYADYYFLEALMRWRAL